MKLKQLLALLGIGVSFLMLLHSLWQLDMIAAPPVWSDYWQSPPGGLYKQSFQCGFWFRTTIGNAYDYFLSVAVLSWFLLLASMFGLLFYMERRARKRLEGSE